MEGLFQPKLKNNREDASNNPKRNPILFLKSYLESHGPAFGGETNKVEVEGAHTGSKNCD